ncbi:MAG TPA: GNAT family N-acetyltransferase [Candidatus Nanopelagicales bacterium]|nr:GNAT family N-acetyltransferase [Candidatus Nanopelagicales bacterium]
MSPVPVAGRLRAARPTDVPEILDLIHDLAEYERARHEVEATQEQLRTLLFGGTQEAADLASAAPSGAPAAYALVVEHPDPERGHLLGAFALYFLNASTWTGTHGIYLEDLYVRPELRGHGYGTAMLQKLARECVERGYRRLEWSVLDWNEPALGFYRQIGAVPMDEWTVQRMTGDALLQLAAHDPSEPHH